MIDKIWVTGAGGLLGNYLVRSAPEFLPNTVVIGLTRSRFDLLDYASFGLTSAMHNAAGHKTSRQRMDCVRLAAALQLPTSQAFAQRPSSSDARKVIKLVM